MQFEPDQVEEVKNDANLSEVIHKLGSLIFEQFPLYNAFIAYLVCLGKTQWAIPSPHVY